MVGTETKSTAVGEGEAFPRGGAHRLTALERKQLRIEGRAEAENDFSISGGPKKRRKVEDNDDDLAFAREASQGRLPKFVELLKFRNLSVGTRIWGAVMGIRSQELVVSLPDGLRGFVPVEEASDVLPDMLTAAQATASKSKAGKQPASAAVPSLHALFRVGQLVRATIIKLEQGTTGPKPGSKKRVILSLRVSRQNASFTADALQTGLSLPACVRSAEDHGYTLTCGIKGVTAFLTRDEHNEGEGGAPALLPGSLVEAVITNASDRRMVRVTTRQETVSSNITKAWDGLTIGSLLPGALVNAKVRNVLSDGLLVSFLTYFTGTIDPFHIAAKGATGDWKASFSEGQRLRARVLAVDPVTKKASLSLLPHLLKMSSPSSLPAVGSLVKDAVVQRVDPSLGVLVDLHSSGMGYAHISDIAEEKVEKLEKVLKVGQCEDVRVTSTRLMDGLAVLSLKPSAVEQYLVAGVSVGDIVKGEVVLVDDKGLLVSLAKNLNAYVSNEHISDLGVKQGKAKYKVGHKVTGRLLTMDPVKRRMTMTLKKALLSSKLKPLATWDDMEVGRRAHGIVSGIAEFGVFVHFYGDMKGLVHISELGLDVGKKPADVYQIGQVVKARVLSFDASARRMQLSLSAKKFKAAEDAASLHPSDVAEGIVTGITTNDDGLAAAYKVDLLQDGKLVGTGHLEAAHLADHPAAIEALQASIQISSELGKLLVLENRRNTGILTVSRKASLVDSVSNLPKVLEDLAENKIMPGYIASVAQDAVFVRFLNGLTGRAGLAQLADTFISNPLSVFTNGQSVRAQVLQVDKEKGHFSLSLKQSATGNHSSAFTISLFKDLEIADRIKSAAETAAGEEAVDWSAFGVGTAVTGVISARKDYGILCDLDPDPNLVGLLASHQVEGELEEGSAFTARILNVNKLDGIVDVTLKPSLVGAAPGKKKEKKPKQKQKLPEVGSIIQAEVQLTREDYAVVSINEHDQALGFVGVADYNVRDLEASVQLPLASKHRFSVAAHPSPETGGRLILSSMPPKKSCRAKEKKDLPKLEAGTVVKGTIAVVHPVQLVVNLLQGLRGRVHVSEAVDDDEPSTNPLAGYTVGQEVTAVVLGPCKDRSRFLPQMAAGSVELSMRPSAVSDAPQLGKEVDKRLVMANIRSNATYTGYITRAAHDYLLVTLGPTVIGRVFVLDASTELSDLADFPEKFSEGQPVKCRVLEVNKKHRQLDLALTTAAVKDVKPSTEAASAAPGTLLTGRIDKVQSYGLRIQVGSYLTGTASLLELHDSWVQNALEGFKEGMFVRCCVIEHRLPADKVRQASKKPMGAAKEDAEEVKDARGAKTEKKRKRQYSVDEAVVPESGTLQLSLKPSKGGDWPGGAATANKPVEPVKPFDLADAKVGDKVCGYVREISKQGVFVALAKDLDARVKLKNLANTFVTDPKAAFPPGKLVKGRIISAEHNRIEISLREETGRAAQLKLLKEGQIIRGSVSRVEDFGVFIQLRNSDVIGLAHISELSDDYVREAAKLFKVGQGVRAKVLKVDPEKGRVGLGLKDSYFLDEEEEEAEGPSPSKAVNEPDLDDEMLDVLEADSDDGTHWRNAAWGSDDDDEELEDSEDEGNNQDTPAETLAPSADLDEAVLEEGEPQGKRRKFAAQPSSTGSEENEESESEADLGNNSSDDEGEASSDGEEALPQALGKQNGAAGASTVLLSRGVGWGSDEEEQPILADTGQSLNGETGNGEPDKGPTKRQLKRQKREQEEATHAAEMARLEGRAPESAADFERELLGSPNSSLLWIRYMAFLISLGEVAKARAVADRALQAIHFREESEKLNVWVAWLNLEMKFGEPPQEAVMKLFQRALAFNDQKKLYLALIGILERSEQEELLGQTFKAMTRKFPGSAKVWLRHLAYLQRQDDAEGARKLLERATASTPARKHIKILRMAALQEFRFGLPERGRSIFESVLRNYPKRLDLWSIYIDQELKLGEPARIRSLFDRAISMQIPAKKIKFLFKRYLEYERQHGTPASVEKVKQAARDFVEQHIAV